MTGEWVTSRDREKTRYFRPSEESKKLGCVEYGRMSKAGDHLKGDSSKLIEFYIAHVALGVAKSKTLQMELSTLLNEHVNPYYADDENSTHSGKSQTVDAAFRAHDFAGGNRASAQGTAMHKLVELRAQGREPESIPEDLEAALETFVHRSRKIKPIRQEMFVINDVIQRAGSMDSLMRLPAGLKTPDKVVHETPLVVGGDNKFGKWDVKFPAGMSAQLAGYGTGCGYNQETNERFPIHPEMNTDWGVLLHYPLDVPGSTLNFYWISLKHGLEAAKLNNRIDALEKFYKNKAGAPVPFTLEAL
ncbi:hypothetical protein [Mycobacteroides chelonae]|uniref:hypothetical protein n=2 Tax=Mycobacteroides TaxID=670516 RepID=UPI0010422770|nr:hypothetical protein [Mycobacteroides chelonae]